MEYGQGHIFEALLVELHRPPCSRQKVTLVIKIMSILISEENRGNKTLRKKTKFIRQLLCERQQRENCARQFSLGLEFFRVFQSSKTTLFHLLG